MPLPVFIGKRKEQNNPGAVPSYTGKGYEDEEDDPEALQRSKSFKLAPWNTT